MRKNLLFGLLILFVLFFNLFECSKRIPKQKEKKGFKEINKKKKSHNTRNTSKNLRRAEEGRFNTSFVPLNIFLDLTNFNYTFPNETFGEETKYNFIEAMKRAKKMLETYLYYEIDHDFVNVIDADYFEDYDVDFFDGKALINATLDEYNFFILFRFLEEDEDEPIASFEIAIEDAGAPIGGVITINEIMGSNQYKNVDFLTNLMLHQFIHLLGFNSFTLFQTNLTLEYKETYLKKEKFPNLINYAKKYFNYSELQGINIELDTDENVDSIHWTSRLLLGELMTYFNYPEEQILSGFTMAFLDDLPYLRVIKNYTGGLMRFGKNKGADFINQECDGDFENKNSVFANEFNLPTAPTSIPNPLEPSCSSGRLSKTVHMYHAETPDYARPEIIDSCPISEFNGLNSDDIYIGHCSQENSVDSELQEILKESFTSKSFCVLSSLVPEENGSDSKVRAVCYEMYCSFQSLTIKIGDNYFVCPRSGGRIEAENLNLVGYLLCPDYNLICTGKEVCNSNYDCFLKESEEKEETFYYEYDIKTTQYSEIYDGENPIYGYELGLNGHCPYKCSQCNSEKTCLKCAPHFKPEENNNNKNCIEKDPNCENYSNDETDICSQCKNDYSLVKEDDDTFLCVHQNNLNHYYITQDPQDPDFSYYIRCRTGIEYCDTCDSKTKCTGCVSDNYKLVDDGTICGELSTKTFYWDVTAAQFKSCPYKMEKCNKCQLNTNGDFECLECDTDYALFHEGTGITECTLKSLKTLSNYYTEDEGKNYYLCSNSIQFCTSCGSKEKCTSCNDGYDLVNNDELCININEKKYYQDPDNNNYYYICSTSLSNCLTCDSKTKCNTCNDNFGIEESDKCIPYSDVIAQLYYLDSDINKYVSCSKISNCQKCTSKSNCVFCVENFVIIGDDHTKCEDLATKNYYKDTDLNQYKPCSYKLINCETCSINVNNNLICEQCATNYALKHDNINSIECSLKSELEANNAYFSDDSKINFYSCSNLLYNNITNCKECSTKNSCSLCQTGYKLVNNDKECISQGDIDNNIYYYNPETQIYTSCSNLIQLCYKCSNSSTCTECGNEGNLEENNTCIPNELVENSYYFEDETTHRYVSCSVIDNCVTCSSRTVCTKCQEGFNVDNNKCQMITQVNDDSDNKLSTGAIIGIVFGCVGFLLLVAGVVYFMLNRFNKKQANNTIVPEEKVEVNEEAEKKAEEVVKSTKRSIHNA